MIVRPAVLIFRFRAFNIAFVISKRQKPRLTCVTTRSRHSSNVWSFATRYTAKGTTPVRET